MIIKFEGIEKLDEILNELNIIKQNQTIDKKWLSVKELSEYLDYSTDRIHKLKGTEFLEGIHYYKRSGKLLFDKEKIDKWVLGINPTSINNQVNVEETVNNLIEDLLVS